MTASDLVFIAHDEPDYVAERIEAVANAMGSDHDKNNELNRQTFARARWGDDPDVIREEMYEAAERSGQNLHAARKTIENAIRDGTKERMRVGDMSNLSAADQDLLSDYLAEHNGRYPDGGLNWLREAMAAKHPVVEVPLADEPLLGTKTAFDLDFSAPGPQLVPPFLAPDGATLIYSRGGSGKGMTACWLLTQLVQQGKNILVLDYESHEGEWGWRLNALGLSPDELRRIQYRSPADAGWVPDKTSLHDVWKLVKLECEKHAIDFIVIDSYVPATDGGDSMGGQEDAKKFFGALNRIGIPSLTICHVKGDSVKFPDRPFGSVFIHSYARETWALEDITERPEPETDPLLVRVGPSTLKVELRNKKKNHGVRIQTSEYITFTFEGDNVYVNREAPRSTSIADVAHDILSEDGQMTLAKLAEAYKEDTGKSISQDTLRLTMERYPTRFASTREGRPRKWSAK